MDLTDIGLVDWDDLNSLLQGFDATGDDQSCDYTSEVFPDTLSTRSHSRDGTNICRSDGAAVKTAVQLKKVKKTSSLVKCGAKHRSNSGMKGHTLKLLAFPSFDKADSLIFFPHMLVRRFNTSDHDSLRKVMQSYVSRNCSVEMVGLTEKWSYRRMLDLWSLVTELHPDSFMCVHTTKVVENKIIAYVYFKFTDSKSLTSLVGAGVKDPVFRTMMLENRGEGLRWKMVSESSSEEERSRIQHLGSVDEDLVFYGKMELALSFDAYSKRITSITCDTQMTSVACSAPVSFTNELE